MRQKKTTTAVVPTDTLTSIFTARRDLLQGVKSVVADSGLTVEEADLLVKPGKRPVADRESVRGMGVQHSAQRQTFRRRA